MDSNLLDHDAAEHIRQSLNFLSTIVREMTPTGAKPIPMSPQRFNLLARPISGTCRICFLPGHFSANIVYSSLCRTALLSLIGFWEDVAIHVSFLYQNSERFYKAVQDSNPTYDMRLDAGGLKGGSLESVLVERVTRAWLKFLAHFSRIRAKVNVVLGEAELARYEELAMSVSEMLLGGLTLSDLYRREQ